MNYNMRETNIEWNCRECNKQFRLFSDDGNQDRTICWNYCPHCGERNEIWIRFLSKKEISTIKNGLGFSEALLLK